MAINSKMFRKSITLQFILLASLCTIISIILTGIMNYQTTNYAVTKRLKTSDLKNIVVLKAAKINIRLQKAMETTRLLAEDPSLSKWFLGKEKDKSLAELCKKRLTQIMKNHDYATVFAVNRLTGNYWKQEGNLVEVISEKDPNDSWFKTFYFRDI